MSNWPFESERSSSFHQEMRSFAKMEAERVNTPPEDPEVSRKAHVVGEVVSRLRDLRGWTRRDLARRTGLSFVWLSLLEEGRALPEELDATAFEALARAFQVPIRTFTCFLVPDVTIQPGRTE